MSSSPRPEDGAALPVPLARHLVRAAASALRRRRPRMGILGASDEDRGGLLCVVDELDSEGVFLDPLGSVLARQPVDLLVTLHDESRRAILGAPLPAYAPVVCISRAAGRFSFRPGSEDGTAPPDAFAPVLQLVVADGFEGLRGILEDGLALSRYMQCHPDDDAPVGRPLRTGEALDILYVNDEARLPERYCMMTKMCMGDTVTFRGFSEVEDALTAFEKRSPDIVWTNQDMPGMCGDEFLLFLRPRTRRAIPTILDSGFPLGHLKDRIFSPGVGAGWFLHFPFDPHRLATVLRDAARMRRAFQYAAAP